MLSGRQAQLSSCIIFPSILGNRFPSLLLEMFLKALKRRWHKCYLWKGVPVVLFWSLALGCVLSLLLFSTAQTVKWKSRVTSKYYFQDRFAVAGVLRQLIWFVTDLWPEKVPEEMILCTSCCVSATCCSKITILNTIDDFSHSIKQISFHGNTNDDRLKSFWS